MTQARNAGEALAAVRRYRASDAHRITPGRTADAHAGIACTGFANRENQARARRAGYNTFIAKPADPLDIAIEIRRPARPGGYSGRQLVPACHLKSLPAEERAARQGHG